VKSRVLQHAYHYTCDHGADGIRRDGVVKPHPHPLLPEPVAWLTDLDKPHRYELGLTNFTLECDRTAHCFETATATALWWPIYARTLPRLLRQELEAATAAAPMHWWISKLPVPVIRELAA
jgi:hypothetical protein